jgi:hypothetical protein
VRTHPEGSKLAAGIQVGSRAWSGCLVAKPVQVLPRADDNQAPPRFVSHFDSRDVSSRKAPDGDGSHRKAIDGVIAVGAERKSTERDKRLWSQREFGDFVLLGNWRLKEAPFA